MSDTTLKTSKRVFFFMGERAVATFDYILPPTVPEDVPGQAINLSILSVSGPGEVSVLLLVVPFRQFL